MPVFFTCFGIWGEDFSRFQETAFILKRSKTLGLFFLVTLLPSCASTTQGVLLGAGIGEIAGGVSAYYLSRHSSTWTMIGAGAGAGVGAALGYALRKKPAPQAKDIQLSAPAPVGSSSGVAPSSGEKPPVLLRPEVRTIWIPDKVEGTKLIRGHSIYLIDKPAAWSLNDDNEKIADENSTKPLTKKEGK